MTVRVRFAPSPTGTLHLGSARSALYNWLHARHFGSDGTYVLRIEDTDLERSTPENVAQALAVFHWLGLDWDEGPEVGGPYAPYTQSERSDGYTAALAQLRASGNAYPCFCTRDRLDADRAEAEAAKRPFIYVGRCRDLDATDVAMRIEARESHVIRCKVPVDGTTEFDDSIHGHMTFANAELGDFVIAREDGSPLYNFANVVDDIAMKITHIIRGNDHLSNTPRQVVLYQALGQDVPLFAHVPMVLGPDGSKLSKRKHHTSTIEQLALEGYVPAGVCNGIALIGWNRDDDTTFMTMDEMVESFDITRVKRSPAAVDYEKMKHINALHLRAMTAEAFGAAYEDWRTNWLPADDEMRLAADVVTPAQAALLVQEKVDLLSGVPPYVEFLVEPFAINDAAWEKLVAVPDAELVLEHMIEHLGALDDFSVAGVEAILRGACEQLERKPRVVFAPVRFAITGRTVSPGLFESIYVLGKDRALSRLTDALARLKNAAVSA